MAASRLNNSQKQELVQRYQAGEASAALAEAFECSTNTVSRTVKAVLGIEAYAALKEQRAKGTVAINPEPINPEQITEPGISHWNNVLSLFSMNFIGFCIKTMSVSTQHSDLYCS